MKIYQWVILSTLFSISLTSCDDDDSGREETVAQQGVVPQGIVILTPDVWADNGSDFEIVFRVNPSNYEVQPGEIALDCIFSSTMGRGVSVQEPDNFELAGVKALSDEKGNPREGEWVATVRANEGNPFIELTKVFLVLTYADKEGKPVSITSSSYAELKTAPAISEKMVSFTNPMHQSYKTPDTGETLAARVYAQPNVLNETTQMTYSMELVKDARMTLSGNYADYFEVSTKTEEGLLMFEIRPVETNVDSYFKLHPEEDFIPVVGEITLTDIFGNTLKHSTEVSFYRSLIVIPAPEELTYTREDIAFGVMDEFEIDMAEYLPKIGITQEFLKNHPDRAFAVACTGYMSDGTEGNYGFGFEASQIPDVADYIGAGKFKATLDVLLFGSESLASGSFYAVLRFIIMDPLTREILINADIRQEIKLVD